MAETEEEEDLLLEQHRAFVPGDDREAAEATPYWADAVALLEKHKRARAAGEQLAERADHERALGRFGEALIDLEHFVKHYSSDANFRTPVPFQEKTRVLVRGTLHRCLKSGAWSSRSSRPSCRARAGTRGNANWSPPEHVVLFNGISGGNV